jgi:hypothetical protein
MLQFAGEGAPRFFARRAWHPQGVPLLCYGFAGPSIFIPLDESQGLSAAEVGKLCAMYPGLTENGK